MAVTLWPCSGARTTLIGPQKGCCPAYGFLSKEDKTHTWASHTTHLSPLSLFLFISRVIHVVLIFKSITLAVHLASTMAQSADCQKLEIQNKIPLSLKETSKQRDVRRLTSNSPNKGNLFILRTASLAQPQGRDGKYPFTVHSPWEQIVSRMKSRGVLF